MKKRSEAMKKLRAGCSKADPQTKDRSNTNNEADRGDYNTLRSLARSVLILKYELRFVAFRWPNLCLWVVILCLAFVS